MSKLGTLLGKLGLRCDANVTLHDAKSSSVTPSVTRKPLQLLVGDANDAKSAVYRGRI